MNDGFNQYKDEYLSLYQGYPDVNDFKKFQSPEWSGDPNIESKINNLSYQTAYTFIYPNQNIQDRKEKNFTIHQDSENEAAYLIKSFSVIELPTAWKKLQITPENTELLFDKPQILETKQLFPSLWKVEIDGSNLTNNAMLFFNEGYDRQWLVSDSMTNALIGRNISVNHVRCDGFANCFELDKNQFNGGKKAIYVYYVPERLNFAGFLLTGLAIIVGWFVLVKKRTLKV